MERVHDLASKQDKDGCMFTDAVARCLTELLSAALNNRKIEESEWEALLDGVDLNALFLMAKHHAVLSLLYEVLSECPQLLRQQKQELAQASRRVVSQSYHLLFLTAYVVSLMEEAGIKAVVLKGMAASRDYPVPELRKSGDVDILLFSKDALVRAGAMLWTHGFFEKEQQDAQHHLVFGCRDGIDIELHSMLAEPFDSKTVNAALKDALKECERNVVRRECMGMQLPMLEEAYHAWELALHSLQHFLRAGFGLKLLCDWVVFWNEERTAAQQEQVHLLSKQVGIDGFVSVMTHVCIRYLGLRAECVQTLLKGWDMVDEDTCFAFMQEVLEAEEFGKSSVDRMVAMRGDGIGDYIREFHHQMRLNYPNAGNCILLWLPLWIMTLIRFCYNNRKYKRGSGLAILRKAGKRSKLISKMHLFE